MFENIVSVFVIVIALVMITTKQDYLVYIFGLCLIGAALIHLTFRPSDLYEHLQVSGEAIQNVGSIYNQNKMIIKDLDVTGAFNLLPKGTIVAWTGTTSPTGWALCDGTNETPDLRGRFIFGFGAGDSIRSTGGERSHKLTIIEMPSHTHKITSNTDDDGYCKTPPCGFQPSDRATNDTQIADPYAIPNVRTQIWNTGGDIPHNIMPPYYVLAYIMKL